VGQVPILIKWQDACAYLQNLKKTVAADVRPLLDTQGHAPFAICREVFSYVDHLGHLYSGKARVDDRFRQYLDEILSRVDQTYRTRWQEIYQMFRCGPVHQFEPKILENKKGELLGWLCYVGDRSDSCEIEGTKLATTHLKPIKSLGPTSPSKFWLPVSTKCLIEDLEASIDLFAKSGPDNERVTAWNRAARELNPPEPFDFTL
jgi:hypothetical protein